MYHLPESRAETRGAVYREVCLHQQVSYMLCFVLIFFKFYDALPKEATIAVNGDIDTASCEK